MAARNGVTIWLVVPIHAMWVNGMPIADVGQDGREVEPEEDLHQHRGSAEEPDVEPAHGGDHRIHGETHHGEEHAER